MEIKNIYLKEIKEFFNSYGFKDVVKNKISMTYSKSALDRLYTLEGVFDELGVVYMFFDYEYTIYIAKDPFSDDYYITIFQDYFDVVIKEKLFDSRYNKDFFNFIIEKTLSKHLKEIEKRLEDNEAKE